MRPNLARRPFSTFIVSVASFTRQLAGLIWTVCSWAASRSLIWYPPKSLDTLRLWYQAHLIKAEENKSAKRLVAAQSRKEKLLQSCNVLNRKVTKLLTCEHRRRQGENAPWFSHTFSLTYQTSKLLPYLVVNTGSILIGLPQKKFLPTLLPATLQLFSDHRRTYPRRQGQRASDGVGRFVFHPSHLQPVAEQLGRQLLQAERLYRWALAKCVTSEHGGSGNKRGTCTSPLKKGFIKRSPIASTCKNVKYTIFLKTFAEAPHLIFMQHQLHMHLSILGRL